MLIFSISVLFLFVKKAGFSALHFLPPFVLAILTVTSLYRFKYFADKRVFKLQILVFQYILISYRAYILQSHAWSAIGWSYVIFTLATIVIDLRIAFLGFLTNIFTVAYFTYYGTNVSAFLSREIELFTSMLTPTIFLIFMISYKNQVDIEKSKEIRRYQQKDSIAKMIITLCHEINNPLTISKLSITRLKKKNSESAIERCQEGLDRVTKITHMIKDIQDLEEINYGENSVMYNLYEKLKEEQIEFQKGSTGRKS